MNAGPSFQAEAGNRANRPGAPFDRRRKRTRRGKDQVRVTIDETWQDHSPDRTDFTRVAGECEVFDSPCGTHLHQHTVVDQQRAIRDDSEVL